MRSTYHNARLFLLLLTFVTLISACGTQDWIDDDLPGNFELWRINSKNISLCKDNGDGTTAEIIVGPYISSFAYNDDYIFLQQVDNLGDSKPNKDIMPNYYLLVIESESLLGPMNKAEFDMSCTELGIEELPSWSDTSIKK